MAEVDGEVVGGAVSRVRELMWILASFAVLPDHQGRGIGTQLMAAAMHHGRGCLRGMFAASADPGAVRRYRLAGFDLHPQMLLTGVVDRSAIPVVERVREGNAGRHRPARTPSTGRPGAPRTCPTTSCCSPSSGWSSPTTPPGRAMPTSTTTAHRCCSRPPTGVRPSTLMWEASRRRAPGDEVSVHHITAANEWALDVGLAARMAIHQSGYLCVRQMKPPAPYLHHGSLL